MEKGLLVLFAGFSGVMLAVVSIAFADSSVAKDVFDSLRASATTVAACVGVTVAYRGLQTWKRQIHGTARFDSCRKFLEATYKMRDEFASMRMAWTTFVQKPGETTKEASNRDLVTRYSRLADMMRECEVSAYGAEVTVGPRVQEWVRSLRDLFGEIQMAVQSTVHQDSGAILSLDEARQILSATTIGKSPEVTARIKSVIDTIEAALGPIIRESA